MDFFPKIIFVQTSRLEKINYTMLKTNEIFSIFNCFNFEILFLYAHVPQEEYCEIKG